MEALKNEITKNIASKLKYYSFEQFESDAKDYIKAVQTNRMFCIVKSVSKSGTSRVLSFHSCEPSKNNESFYYRQYNCLFIALGYKQAKSGEGFTISGCGMDMIFYTNYCIMFKLCKLGLITVEQRDILAQKTPTSL